ncbi:MAG: hypothetical protein ACJ75A_13425 [Actinomycetes bacterium]|jgi:hypothetical protein
MTSLHMLTADDPASVESFLRVRKSRLVVGPYRVRPEKRYDADRLLHDLASGEPGGQSIFQIAASQG